MAPADLDEVIAIEEASFSHPWSRRHFQEELDRGSISRCLVADTAPPGLTAISETSGNVVGGYIMAWLVHDEIHITNLAVAPEFRKGGVATALIARLMEDGIREGASLCFLEVRVSNLAALNLYEGLGFRSLGIRKGYYQDGEDAVVMGVELEEAMKTKE